MSDWGRRFLFGQQGIGFDQGSLPDFRGIGGGAQKLPSVYFSQTRTIAPNSPPETLLNAVLDAAISPVWSIVVLSQQAPGGPAGADLIPSLALGRLIISGGSGGGNGRPIPFDPAPITILTVPASSVTVSIETAFTRIPGFAGIAQGVYTAYAVPYPIGKGPGALFTQFTGTVAAGATVQLGGPVFPQAVDSVTAYPVADNVFPVANNGAFTLTVGSPLGGLVGTSWAFPAPNTGNNGPVWLPVMSGGEGINEITNNTAAPARYAVINRLRI